MTTHQSIEELIDQVDKLVSLPDVYYRLESLIEQPSSTSADFAQLLGADTDLCARLLNMANSAFYSLAVPIDSIEKAVLTIGIRQIRELVLVTSVMNVFQNIAIKNMDMKSFWQRSIAVGILAKHMAVAVRKPQAEKIYVPGLLYDIGSLALFLKRTDEMATLVERHEREGTSIQDLEYEMFSFHHADVGGALLKKWNVPISIVEPVLMHLDPKFSEDEYISSCLIYLADKVVRAKQGCQTNEQLFASIDDDVLVGVNLDEEQLCELWQSAEEEIKVVSRQFVTH